MPFLHTKRSPEPTDPRPKNRVRGLRTFFVFCALLFASQVVEARLVAPTFSSQTASDVESWLSRDPLQERGGVNLYAYCNGDPVNGIDKLGLNAWTTQVDKDGSLSVFYASSSWFIPNPAQGTMNFGKLTVGPEQQYMDSKGGCYHDAARTVTFSANGGSYQMSEAALNSALRNIPADLQSKLFAAAAADRQGMLAAFLLQGVQSGGTKAKIAGVADTVFSVIAGSTAFGDPMMNSHGNGGPLQELMGVDSRASSYLGITEYIGVSTEIGAGLMTLGGAYTGTKQGGSLGGDMRIRPGQLGANSSPIYLPNEADGQRMVDIAIRQYLPGIRLTVSPTYAPWLLTEGLSEQLPIGLEYLPLNSWVGPKSLKLGYGDVVDTILHEEAHLRWPTLSDSQVKKLTKRVFKMNGWTHEDEE